MGEKGSTYQIHDRRGQTIHVNNWLPKSILSLRSYTIRLFAADLLSGVTVGLVALPLAMAFAIASGNLFPMCFWIRVVHWRLGPT